MHCYVETIDHHHWTNYWIGVRPNCSFFVGYDHLFLGEKKTTFSKYTAYDKKKRIQNQKDCVAVNVHSIDILAILFAPALISTQLGSFLFVPSTKKYRKLNSIGIPCSKRIIIGNK